MSLLAPVFLAGLGLLVVPIIIHLTQRQRSQVTAFPSLMFLQKLPFKTTNRRRIRHPLLFALRCLAIILLALAFARPFFETERGPLATDVRDVVILVDASASLGYAGHWESALDSARSVLAGLAEGDRVAVVSFAEQAEERIALTQDLEAAARAVDDLERTDLGTRLDAGLQLAGRILEESGQARREVVLISDFQRTGWEDGGRVRLPDGVSLRAAPVVEGETPNVAVADATFQMGRGGRARILARVTNMGDETVRELPVSLEVGGRSVGTVPVDIGPRGASTVPFENVALPPGWTRGRVTVRPDAMEIDDALRFMTAPGAGLEVLLLEGRGGRADRSLFLERALSISDAPRIRSERRSVSQLDAASLVTPSLVMLNDGDLVDAGRSGRLRDWVSGGGGLLIVLGPGSSPDRWSEAGAALLGGIATGVVDRTSTGGTRLAWLDYDHPVFELFSAPRSGDFSEARFFRFRGFEPSPGTAVLARFESGEPALLEHTVGEGRVLVWTSTLDRFWNDLAVQPVFLPFVHRLVLHATSYREPERWITAGGVLELAEATAEVAGPDAAESDAWILVTPSGDRRPIERSEGPTWIEFPEAGFYQIESLDDPSRVMTVAVNASLEESDLVSIAPERVAAAVAGADDRQAEPGNAEEVAGRRGELWWALILVALLVLGAESMIANRWTRRRPTSRLAPSEP